MANTIKIYTDGSSSKNGSKDTVSAYAFCVVENNKLIYKYCSEYSNHTNNQMELMAVIKAFEYAINNNIKDFCVHADSQYALNTLFNWYPSWVKKNILHTKKNIDLIQTFWLPVLEKLNKSKNIKYTTKWVKAHTGKLDENSKWNNYADELCSTNKIIKKEDNIDIAMSNIFAF
jgi:ribonuclease HI